MLIFLGLSFLNVVGDEGMCYRCYSMVPQWGILSCTGLYQRSIQSSPETFYREPRAIPYQCGGLDSVEVWLPCTHRTSMQRSRPGVGSERRCCNLHNSPVLRSDGVTDVGFAVSCTGELLTGYREWYGFDLSFGSDEWREG